MRLFTTTFIMKKPRLVYETGVSEVTLVWRTTQDLGVYQSAASHLSSIHSDPGCLHPSSTIYRRKRDVLQLGMMHLLKYQSRLPFCPCFSLPLWLHSSLCARRGNKNHKQKYCTSWYFNFCFIPYSLFMALLDDCSLSCDIIQLYTQGFCHAFSICSISFQAIAYMALLHFDISSTN